MLPTFICLIIWAVAMGLLVSGSNPKQLVVKSRKAIAGKISPDNKVVVAGEKVTLSLPAQEVVRAHMALPAGNRPEGNIHLMVHALDVKYIDVDRVNRHFYNNKVRADSRGILNHGGYYSDCEGGKRCPYGGYHSLLDAIGQVARELTNQEQAIKLNRVQDSLDEIPRFIERAKVESNLVLENTEYIRNPNRELM